MEQAQEAILSNNRCNLSHNVGHPKKEHKLSRMVEPIEVGGVGGDPPKTGVRIFSLTSLVMELKMHVLG
jgi:hypothetical protein